MSDYKFDKFYYIVDDSSEHYLSEIEELPDADYESLYKGKMYCPICRGPQLTLVKGADGSHLRTYPRQHHVIVNGRLCPYSFKTASKKVMEEYVNELRDKKKIRSALEAIMRRLFDIHPTKTPIPKTTGGESKDALVIEKELENKTVKKRVIPHYSFKSWGKNIPQDQLLIVYGKVYVDLKEVEYKDDDGNVQTSTYLHFKDIKTQKLITSCWKPDGLDVVPGNYYAAILGQHTVNKSNGYTYHNLKVNYPQVDSILLKSFSL